MILYSLRAFKDVKQIQASNNGSLPACLQFYSYSWYPVTKSKIGQVDRLFKYGHVTPQLKDNLM